GRGPDQRRRPIHHPPGRVLPRSDARMGGAARRHRGPDRGEELDRPSRPDRPRHRGLLRPRLEGHADARAEQPHPRADQALSRAADRAAVVHGARPARRAAVRVERPRLPLPGAGRRDREPLRGPQGRVSVEVRDVAPGLWLWRQPHPDWEEGGGWEPEVASFAVESGGEVVLIDPLAPAPAERELWDRLDAAPPTVALVLKPDHVRD